MDDGMITFMNIGTAGVYFDCTARFCFMGFLCVIDRSNAILFYSGIFKVTK